MTYEFKHIYQIHDYLEYLMKGNKVIKIDTIDVKYGYTEKVITKTRTVEHCTCENCPLKAVDECTGEIYCSVDSGADWDVWSEEFVRGEDYEEFCPNKNYSEWETTEEYKKVESVKNDTINKNSSAIFSIDYGGWNLIFIKSKFTECGEEKFEVEKGRKVIFTSNNFNEVVTFVTNLING